MWCVCVCLLFNNKYRTCRLWSLCTNIAITMFGCFLKYNFDFTQLTAINWTPHPCKLHNCAAQRICRKSKVLSMHNVQGIREKNRMLNGNFVNFTLNRNQNKKCCNVRAIVRGCGGYVAECINSQNELSKVFGWNVVCAIVCNSRHRIYVLNSFSYTSNATKILSSF